jgi:DNA-binding transcriptional MerR regulator
MKKTPSKLFYKIGEVCRITGVEAHVLRYWESAFPRLKPVKNRAGQRIYTQNDLNLVQYIKALLYEKRFTIAGANAKLKEEGWGNQQDMALFTDTQDARKSVALSEIKMQLDEITEILDK